MINDILNSSIGSFVLNDFEDLDFSEVYVVSMPMEVRAVAVDVFSGSHYDHWIASLSGHEGYVLDHLYSLSQSLRVVAPETLILYRMYSHGGRDADTLCWFSSVKMSGSKL